MKIVDRLWGVGRRLFKNREEALTDVYEEKPTSKKALKVLNEKEKQLKEDIMKLIIKSKADDREAIRVCAWILNNLK